MKGADGFRAHVCTRFGDVTDVVLQTVPAVAPGAGEILVENHAFTVGFPDLLTVQGKYQRQPALPFIPGSEFAGCVLACGAGVGAFSPGDAVIGSVLTGAFAEQVVAPAAACFALPASFTFALGAAFQTAYKTAYVALVERGGLKAGETLLVTGAAGGVGLAAVELGKVLGARVIAVASSAVKRRAAEQAGADAVIDYADLRDNVKRLTDGRGVDAVFEPVGGDCFDEAVRCLAPFGRMLVIGFAGGRIPQVAANYVLIKQIAIVGVRAGEFGRLDPDGGERVNRALLALAGEGLLHPRVHATLPFTAVDDAFELLSSRAAIGRIVIEIKP
jgi:NADPH2:quinone reductase